MSLISDECSFLDTVHLHHSPNTLSFFLSPVDCFFFFLNLPSQTVLLSSSVPVQTLDLSCFPFLLSPLPPSSPACVCILYEGLRHKWAINYALPLSIINQSQPVKETQTCHPPGQAVHASLWVAVCLSRVCLNNV